MVLKSSCMPSISWENQHVLTHIYPFDLWKTQCTFFSLCISPKFKWSTQIHDFYNPYYESRKCRIPWHDNLFLRNRWCNFAGDKIRDLSPSTLFLHLSYILFVGFVIHGNFHVLVVLFCNRYLHGCAGAIFFSLHLYYILHVQCGVELRYNPFPSMTLDSIMADSTLCI
jgi:hypothetical protein